MDFNIHVIKEINIGGLELRITESLVNTWFIGVVLIIIAFIINRKLRNATMVPKGLQNAVEYIVETLQNFTVSTMGEKARGFSAFYGSMFIFLIVANISGLFLGPKFNNGQFSIGFLRPPTADAALTFGLAMITFFMTLGYGIKAKGVKNWLKGFTEPMWPLTPINIIGELSNPISLSFRLFGNILGGTIIMGLYYNLPWFTLIGIPSALHGYFDIFAGALQAFIFVMLSMTFVSGAMD